MLRERSLNCPKKKVSFNRKGGMVCNGLFNSVSYSILSPYRYENLEAYYTNSNTTNDISYTDFNRDTMNILS